MPFRRKKQERELVLNIEFTELMNLENVDLLIVRVGTDEIPASEAAIVKFENHLKQTLEEMGIYIPILVVSSLVRFQAVNFGNVEIDKK